MIIITRHMLPILAVLLSMQALPAMANDTNPFREGVERINLTEKERQSLLEYADTSKSRLDEALDDAKGQNLREASRIYRIAIREVVLNSYESKPRTELLMRHALNQALELTHGTPSRDRTRLERVGVLANTTNQGLLTLILEDSIRLAARYYVDDRFAAEKNALLDLPFIKFATQRLGLAREWIAAVTEEELQHQAIVVALSHWLNTALRSDHLHRARYAEELTDVDAALRHYVAYSGANLRKLRRVLRITIESLKQKLSDDGIRIEMEESPIEPDRGNTRHDGEDSSSQHPARSTERAATLPKLDHKLGRLELSTGGYGIRSGSGLNHGASLRLRGESTGLEGGGPSARADFSARFDFSPMRGLDRAEIDARFGMGAAAKREGLDAHINGIATTLHYRKIAPLDYMDWAFQIEIASFQVRKPFRLAGIEGDYCFGLMPAVGAGGIYISGKDESGWPPGYLRGRANVCASVQLGKLGRVRDEATLDYTYSKAHDLFDFSNELELKRVGNSNYGLHWTYQKGRIYTDSQDVRDYRQHLFGIKREF